MKLELNSSEKLISCAEDSNETYKTSNISLEYDAIFDETYTATIGEMHNGKTLTSYTKVTSIHYQTLSQKDTTWKIDVNNLFDRLLQVLLLLFLEKRDDFANKNKDFKSQRFKKILTTINGMPHQLFAAGLQARDIYQELKKIFLQRKLS